MVLFFVYLTIYKHYFSFPSSYLVSIKRVLFLELKYALTKWKLDRIWKSKQRIIKNCSRSFIEDNFKRQNTNWEKITSNCNITNLNYLIFGKSYHFLITTPFITKSLFKLKHIWLVKGPTVKYCFECIVIVWWIELNNLKIAFHFISENQCEQM